MSAETIEVHAVTVDIDNPDGTSAASVPAVQLAAPFLARPVYLFPQQALKLAAGLLNAAILPAEQTRETPPPAEDTPPMPEAA